MQRFHIYKFERTRVKFTQHRANLHLHRASCWILSIATQRLKYLSIALTVANAHACLGALAPAGSVTFVRTVSFQIYQKAKYKYSDVIGRATGGDEPLVVVNRPGSTPTPQTVACFAAAGATAGAFVTAVACT